MERQRDVLAARLEQAQAAWARLFERLEADHVDAGTFRAVEAMARALGVAALEPGAGS